jgi:hypothetical protein
MATEPGAESKPSPSPEPSPAPKRRPWVSAVIGVVVLALIVLVGVEARHYLGSSQNATTRPTASSRPAQKPYTIDGTVSREAAAGQSDAGGNVTVIVVQPAWTSEQQQEWEKRVNDKVAAAWRDSGGNDPSPPKVTADAASVRQADKAMAQRLQAAKSAKPWGHQCTTEFLALLKESAVEAGRATTAPDGAFSARVAPPAGMPYIIHAQGANAEWVDTLPRRSNRVDLNASNRVPE